MAREHYGQFVEEAFVKPIRSVLIIDDDYPTFDELLDRRIVEAAGGSPSTTKQWFNDPAKIKKVIGKFRTPQRPLLVDIHDGSNVAAGTELKIASHLHQSDLLVLDYQLDKSKPRDGAQAIAILRELARNEHFNLVVMHTSEDLAVVFKDTLLSLLPALPATMSDEDIEAALALGEAAEDNSEGAWSRLEASVSDEQYIHSRKFPSTFLRTMSLKQQPYADFAAECDSHGWDNDGRRVLLRHLLAKAEAKVRTKLLEGGSPNIEWGDGATKYIITESVFIAFSAKSDDDDLLAELLTALKEWNPEPSRLFLAKLRAEMDEHGVVAQGAVLDKRFALAHWYHRLLSSEGYDRKALIGESVARHSEQLMHGLLPRVAEFAGRLVQAETLAASAVELSKEHFKVDLANPTHRVRAEREHNALVSSKEVHGWHLTTGHVFLTGDQYWVCVSPACDTVPSQLSPARLASFGDRLPFMAVNLRPMAPDKKLADVSSNRYVFISLDGEVRTFCFNDPSGDASAPLWQLLFAEKRGALSKDLEFDVSISQQGSRKLVQKKHRAKVVAQLRYEYALNLVQRLGTTMTRIGLDFV